MNRTTHLSYFLFGSKITFGLNGEVPYNSTMKENEAEFIMRDIDSEPDCSFAKHSSIETMVFWMRGTPSEIKRKIDEMNNAGYSKCVAKYVQNSTPFEYDKVKADPLPYIHDDVHIVTRNDAILSELARSLL